MSYDDDYCDDYDDENYYESKDWDEDNEGCCDMQRNMGINCSECPSAPECF